MSNTSVETNCEGAAPEVPLGIHWSWSSLLLVQRRPGADSPQGRVSVLAPNQAGLGFIESFDEVQAIWLARMTKDGTLTTEAVTNLCIWHLIPEHEAHLTALLCKSGAMFVVDSEQVYELDEVTSKWISAGQWKFASS